MHTIKNTIEDRDMLKIVFWALVALIVAGSLFYAYLINKTVRNIVEREKAQSQIAGLYTRVGELEMQQIALKEKITPEYAASIGFNEVNKPQFVTFTPAEATVGLSFNR